MTDYIGITLNVLFGIGVVNYWVLILLGDRQYYRLLLMITDERNTSPPMKTSFPSRQEIEQLRKQRQPYLQQIFYELHENYYHPDRFEIIKNHGHFESI